MSISSGWKSPMWFWGAVVIGLFGFVSLRPTMGQEDDEVKLDVIIDKLTGVQIGIPSNIVSGPRPQKWGNDWKSSDERLKLSTIKYHRSLHDVYTTIRDRASRVITVDKYEGPSFTLQGRDPDDTQFYVEAKENNGEVRGISITWEAWARSELNPLLRAIVHSFKAFPDEAISLTQDRITEVRGKLGGEVAELAAKGYQREAIEIIEEIERDKGKSVNLGLEENIGYAVAVACAKPCEHVEVSLFDPSNNLLAKSPEVSNIVIVAGKPVTAGVYQAKINIPGCQQERCFAGLILFREKEKPN